MNKGNNPTRKLRYIRTIIISIAFVIGISVNIFAFSGVEGNNKNIYSKLIAAYLTNDQDVVTKSNTSDNNKMKTVDPISNSAEELSKIDSTQLSYEQWQESIEKSSKTLPKEKQIELYNQGYDFYDIHIAEDLAAMCNKTPQELLELKGKTTYEARKDGSIYENSGKEWSEIVKELNITLVKPTEALGISDEKLYEMKKQGLSDNEIHQVVILAFNYNQDYKDILKELKNGKKLDELKKIYWEQKMNDSQKRNVSTDVAQKNTEKALKKQYNITDDDIKLCKNNGITNIVDIAVAKDISKQSQKSLQKVLEIKKTKGNWKEVKAEMGVTK